MFLFLFIFYSLKPFLHTPTKRSYLYIKRATEVFFYPLKGFFALYKKKVDLHLEHSIENLTKLNFFVYLLTTPDFLHVCVISLVDERFIVITNIMESNIICVSHT